MTRDEGIQWLRDRGYLAVARSWGYAPGRIGEGIYASKAPLDSGGIRILLNALIIYRTDDFWVVDCTRRPIGVYSGHRVTEQFESLEAALPCAQRWIDDPPPMPEEQ